MYLIKSLSLCVAVGIEQNKLTEEIGKKTEEKRKRKKRIDKDRKRREEGEKVRKSEIN